MAFFLGAFFVGLAALGSAQFPPKPEGLTVLKSKLHENVTISFKEPGICETTSGVRSYSGYVHLPPGFVGGDEQNYPINTFFWFFEARENPVNAPLAIWLNGGPGASSLMGLLEENGPCVVAADSKSTHINPWSWNREVNMLYIDQPSQVGFSYDVPTNGTVETVYGDELPERGPERIPADFSGGVPESNFTHRVGTFSSQNPAWSANGTAQAAHALWHFLQTWLWEFPHHRPRNDKISLWAESYGGHYGPGFFRFFQEQNERIARGIYHPAHARHLNLDTLGIVNGIIDTLIQGESWIDYPYNNSYGLQIFNESMHAQLSHEWNRPGGSRDQVAACQAALAKDASSPGPETKSATEACRGVIDNVIESTVSAYTATNHGTYDIAHPKNDPFPRPHMHGYLNEASVLSALGVPVNFTALSGVTNERFDSTYDLVRGGFLESIADLLDNGVKVHLMYGDRDFVCNWVGGEKASLAIPYSRRSDFAQAGYAPLVTANGIGGMTRQLGNLSFSRIYQAGHEVPAYQPMVSYELFRRATFNLDIPTGLLPVADDFSTEGPSDVWFIKNVPPRWPTPRCYVLKPETCVPEVWEKVKTAAVTVKDWFVVGITDDEGEESPGDL